MNSPIDFFMERFAQADNSEAIIWRDQSFSYSWLKDRVAFWQRELPLNGVGPGQIVILEADFSPNAMSLFLALADLRAIIVPLTDSVAHKRDEFINVAEGEISIRLHEDDSAAFSKLPSHANHPLYAQLRSRNEPGLILFSSGSTGQSKAALHGLSGILEKFRHERPSRRTITFLLYDHIGGVNTMLHTLSNKACVVTVQHRDPDHVLQAIARHQVQVLPASPTFLNLILLSEAWRHYDLSSLKLVTYGTEPMPETTLQRFHNSLPHLNLLQTYGLSEVGILRSKSRADDSLWVKLGGEGFETRVVDNLLEIRARSAMIGYLNAPSPYTADGWFRTGDEVEVDGEWMRILGRRSEIINVGGEKVYPAEVEGVLQMMEGIADATVFGEKHPITGMIVCAKVQLTTGETAKQIRLRVREFCKGKLRAYQVPMKILLSDADLHGARFKKLRKF